MKVGMDEDDIIDECKTEGFIHSSRVAFREGGVWRAEGVGGDGEEACFYFAWWWWPRTRGWLRYDLVVIISLCVCVCACVAVLVSCCSGGDS